MLPILLVTGLSLLSSSAEAFAPVQSTTRHATQFQLVTVPVPVPVSATATATGSTRRPRTSPLFGISEWRDICFDLPDNDLPGTPSELLPKREICVLPFPYQEVLLQGETKQLRLYEERFLKLFEESMNNHGGVVAMGLLSDAGVVKTVPICELEAYNRLDGFGIFCTVRVVGRAELLNLTQQEPYLKATCREITDTIPNNLELPNLMASTIENFMLSLSSMEYSLAKAKAGDGNGSAGDDDDDDDDDDDTAGNKAQKNANIERRIQIAKLEDRFYDDLGDDEDDEVQELDRRGRFRQAYNVALSTDTQGYQLSKIATASTDLDQPQNFERTPQELSAISWSAFCTDVLKYENATVRIQALDCDNLFDRLKMASHMLREKKNILKDAMRAAGLKTSGDDFDEEL